MKQLLQSAVITCIMAFAMSASAQSFKVSNLYMFGSSRSFKDTVAYLLPIHPVTNVPVEKGSGFVMYASLYSEQISKYLAEKYGATQQTPAIYYSKSYKKVERMYNALKKRMNKNLSVKELPVAQFEFKPIPIELIQKTLQQTNDIYNNENDKNNQNEQHEGKKQK